MSRSLLWCLAVISISATALCGCRGDYLRFEPPVSLEGWYEDLRWHGPDCRRMPFSCPRCPYYVYPDQRGHVHDSEGDCPHPRAVEPPISAKREIEVLEPGPNPVAEED